MFGMGGDLEKKFCFHWFRPRYDLSISLEQAFSGDQVTLLTVPSKCEARNGSGASKGSRPNNVTYVVVRKGAQQGFFTIERTCTSRAGVGEIIGDPCRTCKGQGRVNKNKKLSVNVPSGVDSGTRIRLSGEGEAGARGSTAGDLYIFIDIKDHSLFRDGKDNFIEVPANFIDAVLGGSIQVPCIDGSKAKMNLNSGTQRVHV